MSGDRTLKLNGWEFWLRHGSNGWTLSVPDRGGMMDMVPRVPEQLAWAERELAKLPALTRTWDTTWSVPDDALADLEALLKAHGATG